MQIRPEAQGDPEPIPPEHGIREEYGRTSQETLGKFRVRPPASYIVLRANVQHI